MTGTAHTSIDRERQLIGSVLWHDDHRDLRALVLDTPEEVFSTPSHQEAWRMITEMLGTGTLSQIEFANKIPNAADLMQGLPVNRPTLEKWASELKGLAHRRAIIQTAQSATLAAQKGTDAGRIQVELSEALKRHSAAFGGKPVATIGETVNRFESYCFEHRERIRSGSSVRFGIEPIDSKAMLIPSYGLILARTSHGKTALAVNMALAQARDGKAPVIFTLEQPAPQVIGRLVSLLIGEPLAVAMGLARNMTAEQKADRTEALQWLRETRLTVIDGRHTAQSISATCQRLAQQERCDAVYIDQMSRIDQRQRRGETKEQSWTRTSNTLSQLWQEIQAPIVLLAQLNTKDAKDHPAPSASHIKDCGSLLEDSCWQLLVDRPEADESRFASLEKQRNKFEKAGDHGSAREVDARGRVWIRCTKDRNSTMGGLWCVRLGFSRESGLIYDPNSTEDSSDWL